MQTGVSFFEFFLEWLVESLWDSRFEVLFSTSVPLWSSLFAFLGNFRMSFGYFGDTFGGLGRYFLVQKRTAAPKVPQEAPKWNHPK